MKILIFDSDKQVRDIFNSALPNCELIFRDEPISREILLAHTDAEIVSLFVSSALKREGIELLPNLKLIVARSTGVDNIDCAYARERSIVVSHVPRYGAHTVAEFTFALILALSRRIFDAVHQVRESGNFKTALLEGFDLYGKTIGVIGTGNIGRNVVAIARGFGMKVLMYDNYPDSTIEAENVRYVTMDSLLSGSDIISLHAPLTENTRHMLNASAFEKIKRGALIINTARGELIDTEALLNALQNGQVAGAGLDVLEKERILKDEMQLIKGIETAHELKEIVRNHILMNMPQVIITPHIAFYSKEAYAEILKTSAENIVSFLKGAPRNTIVT